MILLIKIINFLRSIIQIYGFNSRLDEINAKLLNFKLAKIDKFIEKRRLIAKIYDKELKDTSLILPSRNKITFDVYHLYTVYHPKREKIMSELLKNGIQTRIIYPYPIHKMKAYKTYFKNQKFTICEKKTKGIFCLHI